MNVMELIQRLSELPVDQQNLPVYVHDGMDPSDPREANHVVFDKGGRCGSPEHVEIQA